MIKLSEKEKQAKNLFTYAIVMLLAVIIIIIIAAMADDREKEYQSKIDQTQETANSVQNEIMTLKDELYQLQQENETLNKTAESTQAYLAQFTAFRHGRKSLPVTAIMHAKHWTTLIKPVLTIRLMLITLLYQSF